MPQSLDALITRLDALLQDLVLAEVEHADVIGAVAGQHHRGAVNLVHYTRLRQHDLRELQNDLMDIGATSLATTGFERLSAVPRQILALCEAAHIPSIWATQVLETLAKTGQPSRAGSPMLPQPSAPNA